MNRSDYISSKKDFLYYDLEKKIANSKVLSESYENQLSKINVEDASSTEKLEMKRVGVIDIDSVFQPIDWVKEFKISTYNEEAGEAFAMLPDKITDAFNFVEKNCNEVKLDKEQIQELSNDLNKLVKGEFESDQIDNLLKKGAIPTEETLNSIIESKSRTSQGTKDDLILAMLKADVVPLQNILNYAIKFKVYFPTFEAVLNEMSKAGLVPTENALKIAIQVSDYPLLKVLLKEMTNAGLVPSEDVLDCAIENDANSFIMAAVLGLVIISEKTFQKTSHDLNNLVKGKFESNQIDKLLKKGAIPTEETLKIIIESKSWTSDNTKRELIKATLKAGVVPLDNILKYAIKLELYIPTYEAVLKEMSKVGQFPSEDTLKLAIKIVNYPLLKLLLEEVLKAGMVPSGEVLEFALEKKSCIPIIQALLGAGVIPTEKALILAKKSSWYDEMFKKYTK